VLERIDKIAQNGKKAVKLANLENHIFGGHNQGYSGLVKSAVTKQFWQGSYGDIKFYNTELSQVNIDKINESIINSTYFGGASSKKVKNFRARSDQAMVQVQKLQRQVLEFVPLLDEKVQEKFFPNQTFRIFSFFCEHRR
jgi:hypothetical protein